MYRLIIILILLGVIYWALKRAFFPPRERGARPPEEIGEEMVRDPVCGCYIPKTQALVLSSGAKRAFFCSQVCLDKFKSSGSPPKN